MPTFTGFLIKSGQVCYISNMFSNLFNEPLFKPIFLAIGLHLFLLILFPKSQFSPQGEENTSNPIEITSLSPEEFKNFRTVGVKGGKKEFSIPLKQKPAGQHSEPEKKVEPSKDLSISNEAFKPQLQYPPRTISKDLFPTFNQPGMPESNLNIGFEPPEGVSETELNSTEKIYYGFSKRTYEIYINSLISSFNKLMREKPYVDLMKIEGGHNLSGRIIFNQEGRAISTQFYTISSNENLQQLFENSLMDIRTIPNPPKGLINRDGTFAVHYRLHVGN